MAEKAQVGDLVRITAEWFPERGKIVEVDSVLDSGHISVINGDNYPWLNDHEYVIHRKAGEENEKPKLHCDYCGKQIRGVYSRCTTGNYCGDACAEEGSNAVIAEKLAKRGAEETQADRIRKAGTELTDLLVRKNHDYGDSFAKQYEKYGLISALIRMDDKMRRLETLLGGTDAQVDESIKDSLLDLAGYALLASIEAGKRQGDDAQ